MIGTGLIRHWKMLAAASVAALLGCVRHAAPPTPEEIEAQLWAPAQAQDTPSAYEDYLRLYADCPNAATARRTHRKL